MSIDAYMIFLGTLTWPSCHNIVHNMAAVTSQFVRKEYTAEGLRDRQTLFAITKFRYIEVLFHIF